MNAWIRSGNMTTAELLENGLITNFDDEDYLIYLESV